jgi:hypothetical protein
MHGDGSKIVADRGKLNVSRSNPTTVPREKYDFYIIAPDEKFLAT